MTNSEISKIIIQLRRFVAQENEKHPIEDIILFFLKAISNVCDLTEKGLYNGIPISEHDENWFNGGYHMNFWNAEIQENLYSPLVEEVRRRDFFRRL